MDEKDSGSSHLAPDIGQYGSGFPGCGKTHLALALGVEAVKSGRSVYFATLADIVSSLAKAEREGTLRERLRFLCRPQLLIIDEIGYLPVIAGGGNLGLRHGTYWRKPGTPMSNVYLSILHSMGIHEPSFADSTGTVSDSIFTRV